MDTKTANDTAIDELAKLKDEIAAIKKSMGKESQEVVKQIKETAGDVATHTVKYVKNNPEWVALASLGVSLLIGLLIARK